MITTPRPTNTRPSPDPHPHNDTACQNQRDRDVIDSLNAQLDGLTKAKAEVDKTLAGEQDKNSELWSNCSSLKRQANHYRTLAEPEPHSHSKPDPYQT